MLALGDVWVHAGEVAADRWFLNVDGIAGESTDAAHKGEIDVESWTWGVSNSGSSSTGGGGSAGKASFRDFHFVSRISKASPALFLACAMGSHLKEATLSGVRNVGKGKGSDFLKYTLRDVIVTSLEQTDTEAEAPGEQFALGFAKIEVSYFPHSASGSIEQPVTAGFDLKASKKL